MANGRILAKIKDHQGSEKREDLGSGFALTSRAVVTASHLVRGQDAAFLEFATTAGLKMSVENVQANEDLDVAMLHLGEH